MRKEISEILKREERKNNGEISSYGWPYCLNEIVLERVFNKGIKHGENLERNKVRAAKRVRNTGGDY